MVYTVKYQLSAVGFEIRLFVVNNKNQLSQSDNSF